MSRRGWTRAALAAFGLIAWVPVAAILVSGFLPAFPVRLSALIVADLPRIVIVAMVGAALCWIAVGLGGGWLHRGLAGGATLTLAGAFLVLGQVLAFSGSLQAPLSVARLLDPDGGGAGAPSQQLTFATVDGQALHAEVWFPPDSVPIPAGGRTAVVYIHGGAFIGGSLRERPAFFSFLASSGIAVIDIEYRLAPPPRWNEATPDVLCALSWVGQQAADLHVDPSHIVVMGTSAGGNLALMAGYGAGTADLASSCGGTPPTPAAVIAISPTADLVGIWNDNTIGDSSGRFPEAYIGGTPIDHANRYQVASPFSLIRPGLPPTLVLTGNIDHLVRLGRVTELTYRLHFAGDDCTLVVVPYGEHGFDGAPNGYGAQVEESIVPRFIAAHTGGAPWSGPACPATTVQP